MGKKFTNEDLELFQSVGCFMVGFEHMMEAIRRVLIAILRKKNIFEKKYFEIFVHDSTAKPLLDYFRGFMLEYYKDKLRPNQSKIIIKLHREINEAITRRNDVAHTHWLMRVGVYEIKEGETLVIKLGETFDLSKQVAFSGDKKKVKSTGIENVWKDFDRGKLKELYEDEKKFSIFTELLMRISDNILEDRPFDDSIPLDEKN